jgi:hypothetical protein
MTEKGKKHTFKRTDLIDTIIRMRIEKGFTRLSILEFLKNELGYSQPYAYELIRDANVEFNQRAIQNFGEDLKEDIERFERLYERAMHNKNFREAKDVLREIAKLKGHYTERLQLSGELNHNISVIKLNGPTESNGITD